MPTSSPDFRVATDVDAAVDRLHGIGGHVLAEMHATVDGRSFTDVGVVADMYAAVYRSGVLAGFPIGYAYWPEHAFDASAE